MLRRHHPRGHAVPLDLPQALQDDGGWLNRETSYRLAEYAAIVGERLGDRVGMWMPLERTRRAHALRPCSGSPRARVVPRIRCAAGGASPVARTRVVRAGAPLRRLRQHRHRVESRPSARRE
ncbi:family 1 glycosylhydrolase [Prescottella defluvii]|nr:family 1 glycosylhydrolase [Prescottella defluvii]